MPMTPSEIQSFTMALADAYATLDELRLLVMFTHTQPIDRYISASMTGLVACASVVKGASTEGWERQLLDKALELKPSNTPLREDILADRARQIIGVDAVRRTEVLRRRDLGSRPRRHRARRIDQRRDCATMQRFRHGQVLVDVSSSHARARFSLISISVGSTMLLLRCRRSCRDQ